MPAEGLEPPTNGLQNRCSTAELSRLRGSAQKSRGPEISQECPEGAQFYRTAIPAEAGHSLISSFDPTSSSASRPSAGSDWLLALRSTSTQCAASTGRGSISA